MKHNEQLISAYYDGELTPKRRKIVENHLQNCARCRAKLRAFASLSTVLQAKLSGIRTIPAARFAAQLNRKLRYAQSRPRQQKTLQALWKTIPVGVAALWGFIQAVFITAFALNFLLSVPVLKPLSALIPAQGSSILAMVLGLSSGSGIQEIGGLILRVITFNDPGLHGMLIYISLQLLLGLSFSAWLASWWVSKSEVAAKIQE